MKKPLILAGLHALGAGDSRLYGYILADRNKRWIKLVGQDAGALDVIDDGNPGMTLERLGSKFYTATSMLPWQANYGYVWLSFLTNDVRQDPAVFTVAGFKAQMLADLDIWHNTLGIPYERIVLSSEWFTAYAAGSKARLLAYNQAVKECALARNCVFIDMYAAYEAHPDPLSLFFDETSGGEVGRLHENEAGHRFKADVYLAGDYTPENEKAAPAGAGFPLGYRLQS